MPPGTPPGTPPEPAPVEPSAGESPHDWLQLVDELIGQTEEAPDVATLVSLLCRAADIYERRLADPGNAIVALQAAFRADPTSGRVVQELERLARANDKWAEVVASTAEVVEGLEVEAAESAARAEAARTDAAGAADVEGDAGEEDVAGAEAAADPEDLAGAEGGANAESAAGAAGAVAAAAIDPKLRADLWVQIAFWCDSGLHRLEDAAAAARHALTIDPAHGGALALLEDVYRRQRSWDRYVEVLAQKWENPYRDHYKIAEAYLEALKLEPEHQGLLSGLAHLYQETNQWERAAEILRRLVAVAGSEQRVAIHHRLGTILETQLGDARAAEEHFVQALALDPAQAHVPSMQALIAIYRRRGDWMKAAQLILRVAEAGADAAERARLTFEVAEIYHHRLDDRAQAAELYRATMAMEPEHPGTAEPLSEIGFARGDWTGLLVLAPQIEAAIDARPPERRAALLHRLARAAQATGAIDAALEYYGRSAAADGAYLPTLKDWGALAFERGDWTEAARLHDAILLQSEKLERAEVEAATFRLGLSRLRSGEAAGAIGHLERALSFDPRNRAAVIALAEAHAAVGDVEAVIRQKQLLVTLLADDRDAKLALHEELAELHWVGLPAAPGAAPAAPRRDARSAIGSYLAALELKPDARPVMHKALELLSETKQWKPAVQMLLRLADLEEGSARARYLVAAANILNYELGAFAEAFALYDRALESDPDDLKTFERVDKLLTATKDWGNLERSYRKQITRMGLVGADAPPEKRPAMLALWGGLGEIYRSRIKDYSSAIAAFEVCVALEPEVLQRRAILAELYQLAGGGEGYQKAIAEHRYLLKRTRDVAEMVPHLKTLLRLFVELVQFDHAWCVAQLLVLLGRADGDERQLYEQYRPKGVVRARARLTEELWQRSLYHPDEDRLLSQILAGVGQAVAMARAKEHKEWGLRRKDRRDVATDTLLVTKVLAYAGQVIGVPLPEIYLLPDNPGEIDLANARAGTTLVPSLVIGKDALQGRSETETAFIVTRQLSMLRPDHFLRWPSVVPTVAELHIVLLAAITLGRAEFPVPGEMQSSVAKYADFLRKLVSPQMFEQLEVLVDRLLATRAEITVADVARWARAVYLTVTRAGLLVCNELEVAVRLGQAGAAGGGALDPSEVARDLIEFSVSEEYFLLRRDLGMGLG